jgi:hypothetical protein
MTSSKGNQITVQDIYLIKIDSMSITEGFESQSENSIDDGSMSFANFTTS